MKQYQFKASRLQFKVNHQQHGTAEFQHLRFTHEKCWCKVLIESNLFYQNI